MQRMLDRDHTEKAKHDEKRKAKFEQLKDLKKQQMLMAGEQVDNVTDALSVTTVPFRK